MPSATLRVLGALLALIVATALLASPASAAPRDITITFVRHGESEGNTSGLIDTTVPGPPLTALGEQQAKAVAQKLSHAKHDGVYASTMIRSQQTAQYLADAIGEPVVVLPGLREIEAGDFEGQPEQNAFDGYLQPLQKWLQGDRSARIPGSVDGDEFDSRFDDAVDTIYRSGQREPVAYSHGAAIAMWTMMNSRRASKPRAGRHSPSRPTCPISSRHLTR